MRRFDSEALVGGESSGGGNYAYRVPAVLYAATAASVEGVRVGGRAGGNVKRKRSRELLTGAECYAVKCESATAYAAALWEIRVATTDRTRTLAGVSLESTFRAT